MVSSPPAVASSTFNVVEFTKAAFPCTNWDRALFCKLAEAACQALDDTLFPAAQLVQIDLGLGKFDPPVLRLFRFLEQLRNVKQRF